jgi:CDP-6-deoxy-D-xylo-4-hexulose-3-dehydrase
MLFAGNLVRQPAITQLRTDCEEAGRSPPYRVIGDLATTDLIMHGSFWVGVYPGLTEAMLQYMVDEIRAFARATR